MFLPNIPTAGRKTKRQVVQFGGLNRTQAVNEGELEDAEGVSASSWPCLSTRTGWTVQRETTEGTALFAWGKLISVEGSDLRFDGEIVGTVMPGKKQFAVVNTKLCIFPDKKFLDLTTKEMGDIQAEVVNAEGLTATFTTDSITLERDDTVSSFQKGMVEFRPKEQFVRSLKDKRDSGTTRYIKTFTDLTWDADSKAWEKAGEEDVWIIQASAEDLIGKKVLLKETGIEGGYALNLKTIDDIAYINDNDRLAREFIVREDYGAYTEQGVYGVITNATKKDVSIENYDGDYYAYQVSLTVEVHNAEVGNRTFEALFKPGDRVTVSGCAKESNNHETLEVKSTEGRTITFVTNEGQAAPFTAATETGPVSICRKAPDLDYICESGNRLWGVSNKDKTIYASALGDPTNFYIYAGADTGNSILSYAVPVGTDGDFTAICAYGSNVLCWKENHLHKVLGTEPSNYEVFSYQISGVQSGSEGSLQIINEALYYKGREGVYAYTGGTPRLISAKLGLVDYGEAVGGQDGRSYFISMKRSDTGDWETLSYDLAAGLWMKERNQRVIAFATLEGALYLMTENGVIYRGGDKDGEALVPWSAEFAPFDNLEHTKKAYSWLLLRLELDPGSWVEVETAQGSGPFRTDWTVSAPGKLNQVVPIRPGRCDKFRVRLRGEGKFLLRSMVREFKEGSVF